MPVTTSNPTIPTPIPAPASAQTADQGMTFDSAPVRQATPVPNVATPASGNPATSSSDGMTFDAAPVSSAIMVTPPGAPIMGSMSPVIEPTTTAGKLSQWADDFTNDLRKGTGITAAGRALKKLHIIAPGGMDAGVDPRVTDFIASIPLGLLKDLKGHAEFAEGKHWQGMNDSASGALQTTTIPSAFMAPEASEPVDDEFAAEAGNVGREAGSKARTAGQMLAERYKNFVRKPFSLKDVQETLANAKESIQQAAADRTASVMQNWHQAVRSVFDDVASDAGVQPKPAESLRDLAENTADAIKAKAHGIYQQLDKAIGGDRFQNFDEAISNVRRAIRRNVGIDPDEIGKLTERLNDLEDAKSAALDKAREAGVDPNLINEANKTHRQSMALYDLSKHMRSSIAGLRQELAEGTEGLEQEVLNPTKLAAKANRLYDSARLQQALGEDRAASFLKEIETAKARARAIAEQAVKETEQAVQNATSRTSAVNRNRLIGTLAAGTVGVPGLKLLWHLLGE